jgi:hypothetical protein
MTILGLNSPNNQNQTYYKRVIHILPGIEDGILGFFSNKHYFSDITRFSGRKINDDDTITITARYRLIYKIRGQRMEFAVPKKIYSQIPDDVNGILTFRGENFIRFEYSGGIVEK